MLVRGQVQQQLPPTRCDNACSSPSHPQGRSRCARLGTASPAAPHQTAGSRCPAVAAAAVARSSSRAQSPSTTLRENKVSLTATRKPSEKSSGTTIHQNRLRRHHGLLRSSGTELMPSSSSPSSASSSASASSMFPCAPTSGSGGGCWSAVPPLMVQVGLHARGGGHQAAPQAYVAAAPRTPAAAPPAGRGGHSCALTTPTLVSPCPQHRRQRWSPRARLCQTDRPSGAGQYRP